MNTKILMDHRRSRRDPIPVEEIIFTTETRGNERGKLPYIKFSDRRDNPYLKVNFQLSYSIAE